MSFFQEQMKAKLVKGLYVGGFDTRMDSAEKVEFRERKTNNMFDRYFVSFQCLDGFGSPSNVNRPRPEPAETESKR